MLSKDNEGLTPQYNRKVKVSTIIFSSSLCGLRVSPLNNKNITGKTLTIINPEKAIFFEKGGWKIFNYRIS